MNVNASKVLLFVSISGFTYCSWDHLFPPEKPPIAKGKTVELSAGMVTRGMVLALGSDPFGSTPLDRGNAGGEEEQAAAHRHPR
jgi:hypothetical protein